MQDINTKLEYFTIGIPVRIDSEERKANLLTVLKYLKALQCHIIVLEADAQPHICSFHNAETVEYRFVEDKSEVFHRTHYINQLIQMAHTEVVAIWDTDVLVDNHQIFEALLLIQQGATIAYPYDGRFIMLSEELSAQTRQKIDLDYLRNLKMKSVLGRKLCGGAYLVHKQRYLQCGGENEHFTSWGPEDAERLHRVTILGHSACHIPFGELFHLYHPRGKNSSSLLKDNARCMREELIRVCSMSPEKLKSYITR